MCDFTFPRVRHHSGGAKTVMECPVCLSKAVVAHACLDNHLDKIQDGQDPYDLIFPENSSVKCLSCGNIFRPQPKE